MWATLMAAALALPLTGGVVNPSESAVEYFRVDSKAVHRGVSYGVYLPPGYEDETDRRYPVLYFLHGMFGNERKWESRGCPEILDELIKTGKVDPMIVIFPAGYNGFWINWVDGKTMWQDFLVEELIPQVDKKFRTIPDRRGRAVTGDSMGGYGALGLAFNHPKLFGAVSSHSAMIYPVDLDNLPDWVKDRVKGFSPIYGDPVNVAHWRSNHPLYLASKKSAEELGSLRIYFDCGTEDRFGFDAGATDLHEVLEKRKVKHEYHLRDGNHGRDYYLQYVPYSLTFHGDAFRATLGKESPKKNAEEVEESQ